MFRFFSASRQRKLGGMVNTFKTVTLLCEPHEKAWREQLEMLATLAAADLRVMAPRDWSGTCAGPVFCSAQAVAAFPGRLATGTYLVRLQGEINGRAEMGPALVLPADEREVLGLMLPQSGSAFTVMVRGLVPGVKTTVIAGLLAYALAVVAQTEPRDERPGEPRRDCERSRNRGREARFAGDRDGTSGSGGLSALPPVCWVDCSGSYLPLDAWVAPVSGADLDWQAWQTTGQIPGFRAAAGLPTWENVALLGGSGFIVRPQTVAGVLRDLAGIFPCLVLDLGSGAGIPALSETGVSRGTARADAVVWVADYSRAALLAWETLSPEFPCPAHLIVVPGGGLPPRQARRALRGIHPEIDVSDWSYSARIWDSFGCDGLIAPLPRKVTHCTETLAASLLHLELRTRR